MTEPASPRACLHATEGQRDGAAPGMAAMPPLDPALFVALWRAFLAQKELNAGLRAQVALLERAIALYESIALSDITAPRIVN